MKEAKSQAKVGVGIEALWTVFSEHLSFVLPNLVLNVDVLEGNGELGTVYLLNFGSDKSRLRYQKEKVAVFEESVQKFGLQVIEGGNLNHGFSSYTTIFQLTSTQGESESETLVDIKVVCETTADAEETHLPEETTKSALAFIKRLEEYLCPIK
ncbi:hypothetical protein ACH5RR_028028 [Cinchona calisaya]|uniref:Bet v I/Major latex protein domain-containing protein n=1 Tax=Cinchona calisaya TaxID=153742 RepID=A0ABD2YQU2_9GENT